MKEYGLNEMSRKDYILHRKFFDSEFCSEVIKNYNTNFSYEPRGDWDSWTISNAQYKEYLLQKVKNIIPEGIKNSWINLTVYQPGDNLRIHTDKRSEHTIVINLNEDYQGGDFVIEQENKKLEIGDTLIFNGGSVKHGVRPVLKGIRYSLNYWFTYDDTKINLIPRKTNKTIV